MTVFEFQRGSNTNSTLSIKQKNATNYSVIAAESFRAGSGSSQDECQTGVGWLPAGKYDIVLHVHTYNATIKGRVWQLSDKRCNGGTGTLRTELFIHTEETADAGQACIAGNPDAPYCWEGDNDYYSAGCIKLAHRKYSNDIYRASLDWDSWDGRHGAFTASNRLTVF